MKNTGYLVTLTVKNGPFPSKDDAQQSRAVLENRGISTTTPAKTAKGFTFNSKLTYHVATAALKNKVINKLKSKAVASKLPASSVHITTKKA